MKNQTVGSLSKGSSINYLVLHPTFVKQIGILENYLFSYISNLQHNCNPQKEYVDLNQSTVLEDLNIGRKVFEKVRENLVNNNLITYYKPGGMNNRRYCANLEVYEKIIKGNMNTNELFNSINDDMKGPKSKPQPLKERDAKIKGEYNLFKKYYHTVPNRKCNAETERVFKTLTNEQRELAIKNVVHYIALFEGDDIKYIVGATKFLNEGWYTPEKIQQKREERLSFNKPTKLTQKDTSSNLYEM
jgi:hypothetical protein